MKKNWTTILAVSLWHFTCWRFFNDHILNLMHFLYLMGMIRRPLRSAYRRSSWRSCFASLVNLHQTLKRVFIDVCLKGVRFKFYKTITSMDLSMCIWLVLLNLHSMISDIISTPSYNIGLYLLRSVSASNIGGIKFSNTSR